jgi:hypothetical protein
LCLEHLSEYEWCRMAQICLTSKQVWGRCVGLPVQCVWVFLQFTCSVVCVACVPRHARFGVCTMACRACVPCQCQAVGCGVQRPAVLYLALCCRAICACCTLFDFHGCPSACVLVLGRGMLFLQVCIVRGTSRPGTECIYIAAGRLDLLCALVMACRQVLPVHCGACCMFLCAWCIVQQHTSQFRVCTCS